MARRAAERDISAGRNRKEGETTKATTEKGYQQKIRARMKRVGTYRPEFELTIQRLAGLYLRIEKAEEKYKAQGEEEVIEYTNKGGATNWIKNPLLCVIEELSDKALVIERELGLTPASLKKVNEGAMPAAEKADEDPLSKALGGLRLVSNA